jgi:Na+/proline symporter
MNLNLQDSEPPPPQSQFSTGLGIFLGLLLTLALHVLQLLPVPLLFATSSNKVALIFFFFGFTQLLYMIPAILYFRRRGERGLIIGLIIGASLTFVLGLPVAGMGYICATESMKGFH